MPSFSRDPYRIGQSSFIEAPRFDSQFSNSLEVVVPCIRAKNAEQAQDHRQQGKEMSPYLSSGFLPGPRPEMPFFHHSPAEIFFQSPATKSKLNTSFPSKTAVMQLLETCIANSVAQQ